jgi:Ca2+-binding RTX toxin-like protein
LLAVSLNVSYLGAMEARRHGWLVGLVAALALGAFAPTASAATANITDDGTEQVLHIDAAPGEVNNLWIEGGPQWQVAELIPLAGGTPVHITGDANCHAYPPPGDPIGADAVSCDTPDGLGGIDRVEVNLGDQDDVFRIIAADVPIVVNSGDGNDTFYDSDRTNVVLPVPRTFNAGPGDDEFYAGVDSGQPNDYHGGDGRDEMYYHWRSDAPVKRSQTITLDDLADDGENNEGDNVHSDIEYAFGSDQADVIKGTANADYLVGNGGADTIDGLGGSDHLFAGDAATNDGDTCDADVLNGGDDEDFLALGGATIADGGAGDDHILTDAHVCPGKSDVASGGPGRDSAEFTILDNPSFANLSVSLDDVANDGVGGTDNYKPDIEDLFGSNYGMTLIGSAGANSIRGGNGNDLIDGGLGTDTMRGGTGIDTVDYSSRAVPVTVTIGAGDEDGQAGENDSVDGDIENVRGGSAADTIVGSAADNVIDGGLGADNITGGDGVDAVDYSRRSAPVTVTLGTGPGDDGEAGENDTIAADVEGVFGGSAADKLVGAMGGGFLFGNGGNDDLSDPGGADTLNAGAGDDAVDSVDGAIDTVACGAGKDTATADANDLVAADCEPPGTTDPPTDPPTNPGTPNPPANPPVEPPVKPVDKTAPKASLALGTAKLGKLLSRGLKVSVKSNEGGTLSAVLSAESKTAKLLKRHGVKGVLASGKAKATGGKTKTLTLKLKRKARRALNGATNVRLKLVIVVTDAAGNSRTITRHLRVGS